jgi:Spy/CpxP family protein refolding chaperone
MNPGTTRAIAVMLAVAAAVFCWPRASVGQMRVSASAGGSFQSPVTRKSVEGYARVLGLDEDQRVAVRALYEEYREGMRQVREETNKLMKEMQEEFADTMDVSVWKDAAKKFEPMTKRSADLEKQFFADVQSLLTSEQEERVPALERYRRRETNLKFSMVTGARVDLLEIAERLKLAEASPSAAMALESYELELDRTLTARESAMRDLEKEGEKIAEQAMNMDFSAMNKMMKKMLDADRPLRDLHKTYARRIGEALPEGKAAEFDREFKLRAFPLVYREPHVVKELEAALKFTDLGGSQREEIEQLRRNYLREAGAINLRWASAIEERDDKGIVPAMAFMGGGGENPAAEPRKARRELDKRTSTRLHSLLNEEQKGRLPEAPKRSQQEEMMEAMGIDIDPDMLPGEDGEWSMFGNEDE